MKNKILPASMRAELQKPLGKILTTKEAIEEIGSKNIIVVGDHVGHLFLINKIKPDLLIYDYKSMRKSVEKKVRDEIDNYEVEKIKVKNPAGKITAEACFAVENAINSRKKIKIEVEGEEDLLALPAIMFAPIGNILLYGQPNQGIVLVEINEKIKKTVNQFYERMQDEGGKD